MLFVVASSSSLRTSPPTLNECFPLTEGNIVYKLVCGCCPCWAKSSPIPDVAGDPQKREALFIVLSGRPFGPFTFMPVIPSDSMNPATVVWVPSCATFSKSKPARNSFIKEGLKVA